MAKTRGRGRVGGSRRSRRNKGLEVEDITPQVSSATTLKVKKRAAKKVASPKKNLVLTPTRRSSRIKSLAAQADEVEDVTSRHDEVEDVTPEDGGVVEEDKGNDNEAVQAEKTMSEGDKEDPEVEDDEEACLTGQEQKEDEEEAHNMVEDGVLNEKENKEEALNMEDDGVSNAQDDEIPYTEGVQLPGDEVKEKK